MEKKRHSSNLSTLWIILRLFSAIGSKGTFNELKISYPTVYDMNKFDNLHFRHFRQFLCAEACAVQECQTSLMVWSASTPQARKSSTISRIMIFIEFPEGYVHQFLSFAYD